MLTPRTPIEQISHEPFVQNETLVVLIGASLYGKVCLKDSDGQLIPGFEDLYEVKETCESIKQSLLMY